MSKRIEIKSLDDLKPAEAIGGQGLPLEKWMALLECFRGQHPINYTAAAEACSVSVISAKKAFEDGNVRLNRPAIRDILLLEARKARTEAERKFEKIGGSREERVHADRNAVNTRVQEGNLVHGVAITAEVMLQLVATLLKGLRPLAQRALGEMQQLATEEASDKRLDLKRLLGIFRDVRELAKGAGDIVNMKLDMERKLKGDPGENGVGGLVSEMTPAQAIAEMRANERLLERLALEDFEGELGRELVKAGVPLQLIYGGKSDKQPPAVPPADDKEATG